MTDELLDDQWITEADIVEFEGREWEVDSIRANCSAVSKDNTLLYTEPSIRLMPMKPQGSEGGRWVSTSEVFD